jgi:hypothetical protein
MSLFEHFFKVLSLYLAARIRILIHIKVKGWDSDPDPHKKVTSRIRICIKICIKVHADPQHCESIIKMPRALWK